MHDEVSFGKCSGFNMLTHWGRDKMADILQMTFSNTFSWRKRYEFRSLFHGILKFFRVKLTIFHHLFRPTWLQAQIWLQATIWTNDGKFTNTCGTRPQWVNPFGTEFILGNISYYPYLKCLILQHWMGCLYCDFGRVTEYALRSSFYHGQWEQNPILIYGSTSIS